MHMYVAIWVDANDATDLSKDETLQFSIILFDLQGRQIYVCELRICLVDLVVCALLYYCRAYICIPSPSRRKDFVGWPQACGHVDAFLNISRCAPSEVQEKVKIGNVLEFLENRVQVFLSSGAVAWWSLCFRAFQEPFRRPPVKGSM